MIKNVYKISLFILFISYISCQKHDHPELFEGDKMVGTWIVLKADASAATQNVDVDWTFDTDGTMRFDATGEGFSDYSMTYGGETDVNQGEFIWRRTPSEILVREGAKETRYEIMTDRPNYQELMVTFQEANGTITITYALERI